MAANQSTVCSEEIWKPVVGAEAGYQVSNLGNVRSLDRTITTKAGVKKRRKGQSLKLIQAKNGYLTVNIQGMKSVHRLVLEAFVGACPPGMETCHKNGIRTDNRVDNLYWGTSSENNLDIVRHGNHHLQKLESCPRGHSLSGANLIPSQSRKRPDGNSRDCLACSRARSIIKNHPDLGLDFQILSDEKYEQIQKDALEGVFSRANKAKTHCKRGHLLELPNLYEKKFRKTGGRNCLACGRAGNNLRQRGIKTESAIQELADEYYNEIMARF